MDAILEPQKKTVLMVEDDVLLSDLLGRKLVEKFNLLHAATGEAALDILRDTTPDLVLLDILLPGIDGFEVLSKIKADPRMAKVPVVILSNLGQQTDIDKGRRLGAEEFVVKVSLLPGEVVDLVERVCMRTNPPTKPGA